jgi:hypothetical protein
VVQTPRPPVSDTARGAAVSRYTAGSAFQVSDRQAGGEHLLGQLAGACGVELALQERVDFCGLGMELLGQALDIIAVAGEPKSADECKPGHR